jgi:RimJ/RimL family protein N-acetyltransferase
VLLTLPRLTVRDLRSGDAPRIAELGDNYNVWRNTSDRFPHPYTLPAAEGFVAKVAGETPRRVFAICLDDQLIGTVGAKLGEDIYRLSAELGYWLGEPYWGRGYATDVVTAFVPWAFERYRLVRMSALVFAWNGASGRVLEKCGFELTARIKNGAFKDGRVVDELLYSRLSETGVAESYAAEAPD